MANNMNAITGKPHAIGNKVLVSDMHFGEQQTAGGIILTKDDGKTRGIYPRWGKVYSKGPTNKDPFEVGDWILVEHGRWTRGFKVSIDDEELEVRMVDKDSILAYSNEKPNSVGLGNEYADGSHATIDPSQFVNA